jgi:hypothetical protein
MVPAERAHPNDRYPNWTFVSQPLIFSERGQSGKGYHEGVWRKIVWVVRLDSYL